MNGNIQFVFVKQVTGNIAYGSVFTDFERDKRVIVTENLKKINSFILRFFRKIHLSHKINSIINLPFKEVWAGAFDGIQFNKETKYIFIFTNASLEPLTPKDLMNIKKKYNIQFVLFLHDIIESNFCKIGKYFIDNINFDYIFSFDEKNAKKHNFIYSYIPYSIYNLKKNFVNTDIYYVGSAYDHLNELYELYFALDSHGVNAKFRLSAVNKREKKPCTKIIYNKRIPYYDTLQEMVESNCILEHIRYSNQNGATLRYYEAVCYNKKLLTNNKNVVNLPFYNPDYIHIFEKPDDIDWDWVKERIPVEYHYDGRFSPMRLIDQIIELEEEKEQLQNAKKETS